VDITSEVRSKRRQATESGGRSAPAFLDRDGNLLARFRRGEPEALAVVYRLHVERVRRTIRRGQWRGGRYAIRPWLVEHSVEEADLVQEVFARAFARPARLGYDGLRDYNQYLFGIASNLLVDRARLRSREIPTGEAELEAAAGSSETSWQTSDPAILAVVKRYLARLPDDLRAVHQARNDRGLSQRQAADWLGVSRQNLRTLETRLYTGLRRALSTWGKAVTREGD
jgi:RNA polymerase sigma factor (sigma-70 family)